MGTKPKKISASRTRSVLRIEWEDGVDCEYPLPGLRAACPCAECRGGHENMGVAGDPKMLQEPLESGQSGELASLDLVGNYALQLTWKDGHRYGIYSWGFLRQLCPEGEVEGEEDISG